MTPPATAAVAAGSLVVGFAVAQSTGVRELGGAVLLAGAALCGRDWARRGGAGRATGLLGVFVATFVGSHLTASTLGAWPSVALAAAVTGGASLAVESRERVASSSRTRAPLH